MFNDMSVKIQNRMNTLEQLDQLDRKDGTPRMNRLRQIPPETGKFLAILLANSPRGEVIEIGTSAGYSALWLVLACQAADRKLVTCEILPEKATLAGQSFESAGINDWVKLVAGDARETLEETHEIAFCFLDAEKESYAEFYEMVVPKLVKGGLLVADNAINHRATLQPMLDRALTDERVDALIVPIGKGELICRKI